MYYRQGRFVKRKRARSNGGAIQPYKVRRTGPYVPVVAGYTRVGGFYGRFSGKGAERKFLDTDLDASIGSITGIMESVNLNVIVQGNTESNRVGRKVVLKRVDCKGVITLPASVGSASTSDVVRIFLICDKQTNGGTFSGTDLWETDSIRAFRNLANSSRFQVLKAKTYTFNAKGGSGRGSTDTLAFVEHTIFWKMGVNLALPIEYDNSATTGAVSTQRSNSLWLVTQSSSGGVVMTNSTARVRFIDG